MYSQVLSLLAATALFGLSSAQTDDCSSTGVTTLASGHICTPVCGQDRPGGDYAQNYTGSYSACLDQCGDDPECATAQYHIESGYCYFKNTVNALSSSTTTETADCCPGVTTVTAGNRICTTTCGQDRPGGDYGHNYTGTVDGCIALCGSDVNCITAQYSLSNGYCYLKNAYHAFSSNLNVDSVDCCPAPVTANGRTCTSTCATDRPGGDYAAYPANTVDDCIAMCSADSSCQTAQYHISNNYCYLKNSVNAAVSNLDVDTIDCS